MHRIVSDCQTGEVKYYDEQDNEIPAPEPASELPADEPVIEAPADEPVAEQLVEAPEVSDGGQE